jgi:hypothetical protein
VPDLSCKGREEETENAEAPADILHAYFMGGVTEDEGVREGGEKPGDTAHEGPDRGDACRGGGKERVGCVGCLEEAECYQYACAS